MKTPFNILQPVVAPLPGARGCFELEALEARVLLSANPWIASGANLEVAASAIVESQMLPDSPAEENLFAGVQGEALVVDAPGQEVTVSGSQVKWGEHSLDFSGYRQLFLNVAGGLVRVAEALNVPQDLVITAARLDLQASISAPAVSLTLTQPLVVNDPTVLLQAQNLRIQSSGVGAPDQPLHTQVDALEIFNQGNSGVYLVEQDGLTVGNVEIAGLAETNSGIISQGGDVFITNLSNALCVRGPPGAAGIDAGGGNIALTTDSIQIDAPVQSAGGRLVLQPLTPTVSIGVGSGVQGDFNLTSEELDYLTPGFSGPGEYDGITIGRADGAERIQIGAYSFQDSITLRTPLGGGIDVEGALSTAPDARMRFIGSYHTTTLNADIYTNGDNKLIEDSVIIGAGKNVTISTGPLGGNIIIEGLLNGTPDPGGLLENLTIIGGTGDVTIQGDIGSLEPLASLTIVSAGRVTLNGNVRVSGLFRIINTSGLVDIGLPLIPGGPVGNVVAGSLDIASSAQIIFEGTVTTTGAGQSVALAARPITGNGDIAVRGNLTTAGNLSIITAHDARFSGVTAVTGDLTQALGSGTTRFDKIVSAHIIDLRTSTLVFDDRVAVAADGNLILTADEIDFNGGPNTVSSAGVDTSLIVLRPSTVAVPIKIGTAAGANLGVLDLSNTDITAITDKFLEITIGWEGSSNPAVQLQRKALTVLAAGGSTLAAASVEIKSPAASNDLIFTARANGTAFNDVVIRIFDDATMPAGQAEARYYDVAKLLAINVNLFDTPASAVLDAVNLHTKQGATSTEYTAATRPFTVTGGADYGAGTGQFETVISDKTAGGADDVTAAATLLVPGADNDILFTSRAAGGNGVTIALLNRDVPAVGVQYDTLNQVLTIQARLVDSPSGPAHTRADIIAAVNLANVAVRADPAPADDGGTGELEIGRTDLSNRTKFYGASVKISSNVTAPQLIALEALYGGITTPVAGTVATPELTAAAASQVQLNTSVDFVTATVAGNGNITIGELDGISVRRMTTVNGGIYLAAGDVITVLGSGNGITAGGTGNVALRGATSVAQDAGITTAGGSISVQTIGGAITMAAAATAQSNGGNIRYAASTNVALASLVASAGRISVVAGSGAISDQNGAALNLQADMVRLEAGTAAGSSGDALEISAATLAGQSANGIFVNEVDALTVDSVSVTVQVVNSNLSTSNITDVVLDGLRTTGGPIVVEAVAGTLAIGKEVRVDGAGNIRLTALGIGQNINLNAPVTGGAGSLSILAGLNVIQLAAGDLTSGGGTIDVEAVIGDITMSDGSVAQSGGGNIRYRAANSVAISGLNAGTGAISVIAAASSITDAGDSNKDLVAAQIRLFAGTAIGATANHLETNVTTLAAQAGTGGIYIINDGAVTVDAVGPLVVNRVLTDATTPVGQQPTDAALSDLVAGSHIILRTVAGGITVNPGSAPGGVSGGGNVLLQAQGAGSDVSLTASVATTAGNISVLAAHHLSLTADGDVVTSTGTIDLEAQAGTVTMDDGAIAQTAGANLRVTAGVDVLVGGLLAGAGDVSVKATAGLITDNGDANKDIAAASARLTAGTGIANGADLLDTAVTNIAATAGGNIHLADDDAVNVSTVGQVPANRVQSDGTVVVVQDAASLSGIVTTAANGRIVQLTLNGTLTISQPVSANGSGNVLLQAQTTTANDKDLILNASVASGTGRVSVVANRNLTQAATGGIVTGGAGTIDVEAERGSLTMADGATAQTAGGAIRYAASVDVALGGLQAGTGDVSVIAGTGLISDNGDLHKDVIAGKLRLSAGLGIGSSGNALDTAVSTIAVRAAGGGIYLADDDALTVGSVGPVVVYRVKSSGTTVLVTDAVLSGETTSAGNGNIVQRTLAGELIIGQTVSANGSGNILLQAGGTLSDVTLGAPVVTGSGAVSVGAARDVVQTAAGDINNPGGTIDVEALTGSVIMSDGALSQTGGGNIRYAASNDVTLGGLDAGAGMVSVIAGGDILDGGDLDKEITADKARLSAVAGIGLPADALDLSVATVAAQAGAGLFLNDADILTIGAVAGIQVQRVAADGSTSAFPTAISATLSGVVTNSGDSSIVVLALDGNLTVASPVAASAGGNILLQTMTAGANSRDVLVNALVSSTSGNISIVANRSVNQAAAGDISTGGAGTITVEAQNGSITMSDSGADSATVSTVAGNIRYKAALSVALGGLNAGVGNVSVNAVAGAITDNGDSAIEIAGNNVRLTAGTAIGTGANALEISAAAVAARASSGGVFLKEQDAVTVDAVGQVPANRVQTDGSTLTEQEAATLNGMSTAAANGPVVLQTVNGALTVNQPVSAQGTGNILLRSGTTAANDKDLAVSALVSSGSGNISLVANRALNQSAAGDITTAGGTIDVEAANGAIVMADGAIAQSGNGNIRYRAAIDIALGGLRAGSAAVSVIAGGSITDGGDTDKEITAAQARISATGGVGAGADHLDLAVSTLASRAGAAGLYVTNDTALSVDTVAAVMVKRVDADGTAPVGLQITDAVLSDVISVGSLVLRTVNGAIAINDGSAPADATGLTAGGNLLLQAQGTSGDLIINAAVNGDDNGSLIAARNITQTAVGDVVFTSALDVQATAGSITMADGAVSQTRPIGNAGNIRYVAATDITLGSLNAGLSSVSVIATGSIMDGGDADVDVVAASVRLMAGVGIGAGANHLELSVARVAAQAAGGGIFLTNSGSVTVQAVGPVVVNRVDAAGAVSVAGQQTDPTLSDLVTTADNGSIVLVTANGSITVNDEPSGDGNGVRANGTGNIRLESRTTAANDKSITLNAVVRSTAGRITVLSNANVTQSAPGDLLTGSGSIDVEALNGSVTMADGAIAQTSGGSIRYKAAASVTIGGINAASGDISVIAGSGSILDGGDTDKDVRANRLRLVAGNAIGAGSAHLDTAITTLAARAGAGGIFLVDDDALTVDALGAITVSRVDTDGTAPVALRQTDAALTEVRTTAGDGHVVLTALNGSLTLNQSVVANGDGNLRLAAQTTAANDKDVVVNALIQSGTGDITILANRHISQSVVGSIATAGGAVDVEAAFGSITMQNGALTSSGGGGIRYQAAVDVALGGIDAGSGGVSIAAVAGGISDNGDLNKDIAAGAVRLVVGTGIGSASNPLEIAVTTLSARANAGGVFLLEDDDIAIGTVGPLVFNRVDVNGTTPAGLQVTEAVMSDLVTGGNGSIVLQTVNGGISVNDGSAPANGVGISANGSGNILLEAQTTANNDKDIRLNGQAQTGSGNISLIANRSVIQSSGGLGTGGAGTIEVEAKFGSITMSDTVAVANLGDIRYKAALDVTIGYLATAGNVSVIATGGSILDGGDIFENVSAAGLRLAAGTGIGVLGASANAIETNVAILSARAEAGGINLLESDGLSVNDVQARVQRVKADATTSLMTDAAQSDVATISGDGSIVLQTLNGALVLNDGAALADGLAVSANGAGNILLAAGGTGMNLTANADVSSSSGHITVLAASNTIFNTGADLRTGTGGTVDVEAAAGSVMMNDNSLFTSGSGDIRVMAAVDVVLGGVSTGGNVSLTATAGSILDGGNTYLDVAASGLRLVAGTGVGVLGVSANALETSVATVSARADAGGINLLETDALVIGNVAATVQKVTGAATVTPVTDATQSDLVTSGNGSIVVQTTNGNLTLDDGSAPANGVAITANGSGNVLLIAGGAGNLQVNADIVSNSGNVSLAAGGNLSFAAGADVRTSGSVNLQVAGNIQLSSTSVINAGTGDIRIVAAVDVMVTGVSTAGNVSLIATTGSILDAGDAASDVSANGLRLVAAVGVGVVGASANPLETNVSTVSARAAAGGINLLEANAIGVDNVAVTVQQVLPNNSVLTITDAAQSDLATTANGAIVLRTTAGSITLNDGTAAADGIAVSANGSGNILLEAGGTAMSLVASADVLSGTGHVTVFSRQLTFNPGADIRTSGTGTIGAQADAGNITMSATSVFGAGSGDVRLLASAGVAVGSITTAGNVSITGSSGSITNAGVTGNNVTASRLRLVAGTGIGVLGAGVSPLKTEIATLSASAGGGGVNILEATNLTVDGASATIQQVQSNAGVSAVTDATQNDVVTTTGNGAIVLQTTAGTLTLNEGSPSNLLAVSANGSGNVLLVAGGANSDVIANSDVRSLTGHVTLLAARNVTFNDLADIIIGGTGTIDVEAQAGSVSMSARSQFFGGLGDIRVVAATDVTIGNLSNIANVSVTAGTGSILDGSDNFAQNIFANGLRLVAGNGIGVLGAASNAIETSVAVVSARARAGGVNLAEVDALTVNNTSAGVQKVQADATSVLVADAAQSDVATASNGSICLTTAGTLTLNDGSAPADSVAVSANGAGNVLLAAGGANSDVLANADVRSGAGHITLTAGRNITLGAAVSLITSGTATIDVEADAGSLTMSNFSEFLTGTGDIRLRAALNAVLGSVTTSGNVSATAGTGSITDAGVGLVNVTANQLRLAAGNGVGTAANPLLTNVATVSARAAGGGINLREANAIFVDDTSATVQKVQTTGLTQAVTDAAQSDLATTASGWIVLRTVAGGITLADGSAPANNSTVTANGSGNVLLSAGGAASNVVFNPNTATVSGTGHVTILAGQSVSFAGQTNVTTAGTGTIDLEAGAGSITMASSTTLAAGSGDLRLLAATNVVAGVLSTIGNVSITATTGAITDAGIAATNISANQLRLVAGLGVGVLGAGASPLKTSVARISARATSGGINVLESNDLEVNDTAAMIQKVQNNASVVAVTDAAQSDAATSAGNGSIVIRTTSGSLLLNDGAASANNISISANGSGNVLLSAGGAASDVAVNADVVSGSGHVTILGARAVNSAASADIRTGGAGTIDVEAGTSLTMNDNSLFITGSGDIRLLAAQDVTLGGLSTAGNVAITATTGSILDGGNTYMDVAAGALLLFAGNGVGVLGASANALETNVVSLSARATGGGVNILESDALAIDDTSATVQRVQPDASLASLAVGPQSDVLTTAGNGSIVLQTVNGNLQLSDGLIGNDLSVRAHGSGNVLLAAGGSGSDLNADVDIASGTGHITLQAAREVTFRSGADIRTSGTGTIDVEAGTGSIRLSDNTLITTGAGDIRLFAAVDVALGGLNTSGNASLTATAGSILHGGNTYRDVIADSLRLVAGVGVGILGANVAALEITVARVSARAAGGGINLSESDALIVDNTSATVQKVLATALTTPVTDAAQSDVVTTAGNGSIVIQTLNGSLTLNDGTAAADGRSVSAQGSGNLALLAAGAGGDILANVDVLSGSGHVTLTAERHVTFAAGADLRTSGAATIAVSARTGNLTMSDNSLFITGSGDLRLWTLLNVTLGGLNTAGNASVTATNGSILDGGDAYVDVVANGLRLASGVSIGSLGASANAIETAVTTLSASTGAGGVNILETDALAVNDVSATIQQVQLNASVAPVSDPAQGDVVSSGGAVVLRTSAGAIALNDGDVSVDALAVKAVTQILVQSGGTGDVTLNAGISSASGNVTVLAGGAVTVGIFADILTGASGTIDVEAAAGSITMADISRLSAATGDIRLLAASNVTVGGISTAGNVSITATAGSILDGSDNYLNLAANGLRLVAGVGIGTLGASANALEISVNTASARAAGGGINLLESNSLSVGNVSVTVQKVQASATLAAVSDVVQSDLLTTAGNGSIVVRTLNGALALNDGTAPADGIAVRADGSGNILLAAGGLAGDLTINASVLSGSGNISLLASRTLNLAAPSELRAAGAGTLDLEATTGSILMAAGAKAQTEGGNIRLVAGDSVAISLLDARTTVDRVGDSLAGQSAWGKVSISAAAGSVLQAAASGATSIYASSVRLTAANTIGGFASAFTYRLQVTTNLTTWTELTSVTSTLTQFSFDDTTPAAAMKFYRVLTSDSSVVAKLTAPVLLPNGAVRLNWSRVDAAGARGALRLETSTVTANGGAGGINLMEATDITVASVDVSVNRVDSSAGAAATSAVTGSDLRTQNGGVIVLRATNGSLVLNDGSPDNTAVSAQGGGNILLEAGGSAKDVTINADVLSGSGHITILGTRQLSLSASADILTGGTGTVDVEAGNVTMNDNSLIRSGSGDLRLLASGDVVLGGLSTSGNVSVTASAGAILDAGNTYMDVAAGGLRLSAANGVGALGVSANSLETAVGVLSVSAGGSINVLEADGLAVDDVAVTVRMVQSDGSAVAVSEAAQSDVATTANNGAIVLQSLAGALVFNDGSAANGVAVSANGSGNIRLAAAGDLLAGADFVSGTGHVTLTGNGDVSLTAAAHVRTGGAGGIDVQSALSFVRMADSSSLVTDGGNIRIIAARNALVGMLDARTAVDRGVNSLAGQAGWGAVSVSAGGSVLDAAAAVTTGTRIYASGLQLSAVGSVGVFDLQTYKVQSSSDLRTWNELATIVSSSASLTYSDSTPATGLRFYQVVGQDGLIITPALTILPGGAGIRLNWQRVYGLNALEIESATLAATAGIGGINLLEQSSVTVDAVSVSINRVSADGSATLLAGAASSDLAASGVGSIVLRTVAGSLVLNQGATADNLAVNAAGTGNVLLLAGGANADVQLNANVTANGGSLTVQAARSVLLSGVALRTSGAGTVDTEAAAGSVLMSAGALIQTSGGNIRVKAAQDALIGRLDARTDADRAGNVITGQSTWGSVSVTATAGSIRDADTTAAKVVDVFANAARFVSGGSVGEQNPANPLETELATIAILTGGGGLNVLDLTALRVGTVGTVAANRVQSDGTTLVVADNTSLTGAVKSGGIATILSDLRVPVENYSALSVVTVLRSDSRPNNLTGLYEQTISIANPTGSTIDSVRIYLQNLPAGALVPYANGYDNGVPFVQYNRSLAAGETVSMVIEYRAPTPSDIPTAVNFYQTVSQPLPPVLLDRPLQINVVVARQPDNRYLLTFGTLSGHTYYIDYSDDGVNWTTSPAPIAGTGATMTWLDLGPPKTYPDSSTVTVRFYRVLQI